MPEYPRWKHRQCHKIATAGRRENRAVVCERKLGNVEFAIGAKAKYRLLEGKLVHREIDTNRLDSTIRDIARVDVIADCEAKSKSAMMQ
jgi:hypothetical protein